MQAPGLFDGPDKRGKYGLVHNIGLGGAVVCSLLRRPEFFTPGGEDGRKRYVLAAQYARDSRTNSADFHRLGYNHAHECRPITRADLVKVQSRNNSPYILQRAKL